MIVANDRAALAEIVARLTIL